MRNLINKALITISLLSCSLFIYAQGLEITQIDTKLEELTSKQAEHLEYLVYQLPNYVYMNKENGMPEKLQREREVVEVISFGSNDEIVKIAQQFKHDMETIKLLNIFWDGSQTINLPNNLINQLHSLQYVYIRSKRPLNTSTIELRFLELLNQLSAYEHISIVYEVLEQEF